METKDKKKEKTKNKCDLNTLVVDLFDFQGKAIPKSARKSLKIRIAPFFVLLENDILTTFGRTKLDVTEIESPEFRERYKYLSQNYTTVQIAELYRLLTACRNTMCHLLFRARENADMYTLAEPHLLDSMRFFEDVECQVDGQITLQGMFSLMILFMSNQQISELLDIIPSLPELCCGRHFYKKNDELGLKSGENGLRIKNELKGKFRDLNDFSVNESGDASLGFFNYKFISTLVCDAVFTVENYFYNLTDARLCRRNSNFNEAFGNLATQETKDAWIKVRNSWAHGDFHGIRNGSGSNLLSLVIDALDLTRRDMDAYNGNGCGKVRWFAHNIAHQFANRILSHKYRRAVELAVKISMPDEYDTADRVKKMAKYTVDNTLILPDDEKRLFALLDGGAVTFDFKHKIPARSVVHVKSIELYTYILPEGAYATVQGVRLDETFAVANVDGCVFQTVEIYSADDTPVLALEPTLVQDLNFFKSYVCEVKCHA